MGASNAYTPAKTDFAGDAYTPANEIADLVFLNMAAPVRIVSDMRGNPKTLNSIGVYIYNSPIFIPKKFKIPIEISKQLTTICHE